MPKSPILSREVFLTRLNDGSLRELDWALVNTDLGGMVEPRPRVNFYDPSLQVDIVDASYTRSVEIKEDEFNSLMGTYGRQVLLDFNY